MSLLNEGPKRTSNHLFDNKEKVLKLSNWMEIFLFWFQTQLYERKNLPVGDRLTHQWQLLIRGILSVSHLVWIMGGLSSCSVIRMKLSNVSPTKIFLFLGLNERFTSHGLGCHFILFLLTRWLSITSHCPQTSRSKSSSWHKLNKNLSLYINLYLTYSIKRKV